MVILWLSTRIQHIVVYVWMTGYSLWTQHCVTLLKFPCYGHTQTQTHTSLTMVSCRHITIRFITWLNNIDIHVLKCVCVCVCVGVCVCVSAIRDWRTVFYAHTHKSMVLRPCVKKVIWVIECVGDISETFRTFPMMSMFNYILYRSDVESHILEKVVDQYLICDNSSMYTNM